MKTIIRCAIIACATGAFSSPVAADSLFPGSSTAVKTDTSASAPTALYSSKAPISLYTDVKAHNVGDVLTITVEENASASSTAETKSSKTENEAFGPGTGQILGSIGAFGLGETGSSDGAGSTNRSDTLTTQIAVTVKEVLPNGNLKVEGERKVTMNTETETQTFTGVVRPDDITAENTVPSPLVADAQIKYSGKGPVGDKQHEGIITKIFKLVF